MVGWHHSMDLSLSKLWELVQKDTHTQSPPHTRHEQQWSQRPTHTGSEAQTERHTCIHTQTAAPGQAHTALPGVTPGHHLRGSSRAPRAYCVPGHDRDKPKSLNVTPHHRLRGMASTWQQPRGPWLATC